MICKNCGTENESYLEYCKNCAEELIPDEPSTTAPDNNDTPEETPVWGMLRMPKWKRPTFSADDIYEDTSVSSSQASTSSENISEIDFEDDVKTFVPSRDTSSQIKTEAAENFDNMKQNDKQENEYDYFDDDDDQEDYEVKKSAKRNFLFGNKAKSNDEISNIDHDINSGIKLDFDDEDEKKTITNRRYAPPIDDDYFHDSEYRNNSTDKPIKKQKNNTKKLIIIIAAAAVLLVVTIIGFVFISTNYGNLGNFTQHVFGGNPLMRPVTIDISTDANGNEQVIFYINASEGHIVRFMINDQIVERTIGAGNSFSGSLMLSTFMPNQPIDTTDDYIVITPNLSIVSPDGSEVTPVTSFVTTNAAIIDILAPESTAEERAKGVTIEGIPVFVPTLKITISEPTVNPFNTEVSQTIIKGTVNDNSATLYANGEPLTLDSLGGFEYTLVMEESGSYTVNFEAQKNGCRVARENITVNYTKPEMSMDLTFLLDNGVQLRTKTNTLTITGKIDPGATLQPSCEDESIQFSEVTYTDTGAFTFSATIPEVGYYDIDVLITLGSDIMKASLHIERAPENHNDYYATAHEFDYDRCLNQPNHDAHYLILGYVREIVQSEGYAIAKLETEDGEIIYFQYHNSYSGAAVIEVSSTQLYRLAAVPCGTYDDSNGNTYPYLYAWFVIKPGSGN